MEYAKQSGILYAVLLCTGLLVIYALLVPPRPLDTIWACACDEVGYWNVSNGELADKPFAWRILHPSLAGLLPFDRLTSFAILAYSWLVACGLLTFAILRHYGFNVGWSLVGLVLLASLDWFAPYLAWNVYLVDGLAMVFILLAIYAALNGRAKLFFCALVVGVFAKESVLFVAPLWVTLAAHPSRRHMLQAAIMGGIAFVVLLLLRLTIEGTGNYSYPPLMLVTRFTRPPQPLADYFPFGILPFLALASTMTRRVLTVYAVFLVLVYVQLVFAADTGRLLVIGYLPFLIVGLDGLRFLFHMQTGKLIVNMRAYENGVS